MPATASIDLRQEAIKVLRAEMDAIEATLHSLDHRFEQVISLIEAVHTAQRKVIFTGIGKNVFIAQKLAATFNSTGVEAIFIDPLAALHGDLGLCKEGDLALIFSNSGESDELIGLIPPLKRLGVTTVAVTKEAASRLAKACDKALLYSVPAEACPLQLAPTASTTAALALGDTLAMVFLKKRGFRAEDFAKYHPSGTLGKTLLLKVSDVMRPRTQMAVVERKSLVIDALNAITNYKTGVAAVIDETGKLIGVFTDGDFRRLVIKIGNPLQESISAHMIRNPKTINSDVMAVEALKRFQSSSVNQLIVVDEYGFPVGVVDSQDLPKLKLV